MINLKLRGCIFGAALSDAYALQTEFFTEDVLREKFANGITFLPTKSIRGFKPGDWTDDTDRMIIALDAIKGARREPASAEKAQPLVFTDDTGTVLEYPPNAVYDDDELNSEPDAAEERLFAFKLLKWKRGGFPDLGDKCGNGCDGLVSRVVSRQGYLVDPIRVAFLEFLRTGGSDASNSPIPSAIAAGCIKNYSKAIYLSEMLCRCISADSRSVAACIAITHIIHSSIHEDESYDNILEIIGEAKTLAKKYTDLQYRGEFMRYVDMSLDGLCLDDVPSHIFKAMGAGMWSARELYRMMIRASNDEVMLDFKEAFIDIITRIVMRGGNSCTNALVAGAVMGAIIGHNNLPDEWLNSAINREWLDSRIMNSG